MSYGAAMHSVIAERDTNRRRRDHARRTSGQEHAAAGAWVRRYLPDLCHATTGEPHPSAVDAAWYLRQVNVIRHLTRGVEDRRPTPDEVRHHLALSKPWLLDDIEKWRTS